MPPSKLFLAPQGSRHHLQTTTPFATSPPSFVFLMSSLKIHPTTLVANIKNCVLIQLDDEGTHFNTWCTLFKLHYIVVLILLKTTLFPVTIPKHPLPIPNGNVLTISFRLGFMPLLLLIVLKMLFILMILPKMHGIAFYKIFKITKPLAFFISKLNSMI